MSIKWVKAKPGHRCEFDDECRNEARLEVIPAPGKPRRLCMKHGKEVRRDLITLGMVSRKELKAAMRVSVVKQLAANFQVSVAVMETRIKECKNARDD